MEEVIVVKSPDAPLVHKTAHARTGNPASVSSMEEATVAKSPDAPLVHKPARATPGNLGSV